ncbi:Glycosyltransferase involved in cell wall bisynthesis [Dyella jiangningensis]|uniref:glycosyltransferase n=1 Tax=Dyella sp. AtDHG13 TaxID=1938897 RepID=UPI00088CA6BC|nr:glycosyltransferase [Dyella sp. AtDHG13]PXV58202.1 glycosyltransferase involved in cell wall biosynthesis [Dyella sp. AtDHG13]SDK12095.1 Glycosyltransferase involved in cell wall bisynthesis [Dyella jiangningensis]
MATRADRILLVLPSLERGGGERVLLQLAGAFQAAGREVHVAALLGGGPLRSAVPGSVKLHELVDVSEAPKSLALARKAFPRLASLIRVIKPQAVLSTMTGTNLLVALTLMRARVRARLILREASSLANTRSSMKRQAMRWLYRRAYGVVAVSAGVAQDLRGIGLASERIHIIRNPVDVERLRHLAKTGLVPAVQRRTPYIVSLGRLTEAKDFPTLLRAYALSALMESHCLVIVGAGEQRLSLEALIDDLGLGDRVLLTGALDNPYRVLAEAKLHVLSSRWEGCPNVLLEALALGVPVVCTDCAHGPREILDGGRYGRLVPVGDAGALAGAMDAELERPSSPGDAVIAAHSSPMIASRYLDLLDGKLED